MNLFSRPNTFNKLKRELQLPKTFAEAHVDIKEHVNDGVYLLANGDLGVVFEFSGLHGEIMTYEALTSAIHPLYKTIMSLCTSIPAHEDFQNMVLQLTCSQRALTVPESTAKTDGIAAAIIDNEQAYIHSLGLASRRFFLSVRYSPVENTTNLWQKAASMVSPLVKNPKDILNDKWGAIYREFELFNEALISVEYEASSKIALRRLTEPELLAYFQNVFHGAETVKPVPTCSELGFNQAVYNPRFTSKKDGLYLDADQNKAIKAFYLNGLPGQYRLGSLNAFMDQLPIQDFDLVFCLSGGRKSAGQELTVKASWFERGPSHLSKYDDLISFQEKTGANNPYATGSLRLLIYENNKSLESVIKNLAVDLINSRMVLADQIPIHMIATSLPLCLAKEAHQIIGTHFTTLLDTAAMFFPVYGGAGNSAGKRVFVSRNGLPTGFDLFAGSGNKMTTVLGTSGAGKSCLINQVIAEFLSRFPGGLVRIIDKKTSYEKLTQLLGGQVIRFCEDELRRAPYSPFAIAEPCEDDVESLCILITSAIMQKNKDAVFSSLHSEILKDAIKIAYNTQVINEDNQNPFMKIDPHPVWMDVIASLAIAESVKIESGIKGATKARQEIVKWSVNLSETGQYGFLFCQHEKERNLSADQNILVYDLDGIADPVLSVLAGQLAFIKISRDLKKAPKSTPKLIIFEELGILLQGDDLAQKQNEVFIQNVVKTCRKYNAMAMAISNEVDDFVKKPAGRTFWNIASQKVFLPLGVSLVKSLQDSFPSEFSEADIQILASLELEKAAKRSALYLKSENDTAPYKGSVYLPLSPQMDAISTTSPKQLACYERLLEENKTPKEAILFMAKFHPYGEGL